MENKLFRTHLFGGYRQEDVDTYIERLELEIVRLEGELERSLPKSTAPLPDEPEDFMILNGDEEEASAQAGPEERDSSYEQLKAESEEELREALKEEKSKLDQMMQLLQKALCEKQQLEQELERLQKDQQSYEEDRDAIKEVLMNARVQAEVLLTKARKEARLILEDAQNQASQQQQAAIAQLMEDAHRQIDRRERETIGQLMGQLNENYNGLQTSKYFLIKSIESMEKQIAELQDRMGDKLNLTEAESPDCDGKEI